MESSQSSNVDISWFSKAACKGHSPELFFPDPESSDYRSNCRKAEEICKSCSVIVECAEYALETKEKNGVWGGKSSWGTSHRPEGLRYIERLKLLVEYEKLLKMPNSKTRRELIQKNVLKQKDLKNVKGY